MIGSLSNENWYSEVHTPEMAGQGEYEYIRLYPSAWQMRFMAFNAIIRGATGMEWALFRTPVNAPVWQEISQLIGELQALHDVLAAPDAPAALEMSYRDLGFGDWSGVEALVKRADGAPWVLAANTQFDPAEVTISGLPAEIGGHVAVFGENRTLTVTHGRLTDRFRPYEVHVQAAA